MNTRFALPGLATGVLGLVAGLIAYAADNRLFGAVAGLLALAAGVSGVRLAQQLGEQAALQRLVEDELRVVRAETQQALVSDDIESDYDDAEDLETLTDARTGLFSESFFNVALESRVAAARRHLRPVAVVLLEVVEGLPAGEPTEAEASIVAQSITATLREADTACRLRNGYFALLLEDTPENGAIWTVERVRRQLLSLQSGLTLWAGVACYPAHAFSTDELMRASEAALEGAREWRQDRIEVATAAID